MFACARVQWFSQEKAVASPMELNVTAIDPVTLAATKADRKHAKLLRGGRLSGADAGRLARQVRRWHHAGQISLAMCRIAEGMILDMRQHGQDLIKKSMTQIARATGTARSTVALALRALERLGLFQKIKVRIRLRDWVNGGVTSRQGTSVYVFLAPENRQSYTESDERTVSPSRNIILDVATPLPASAIAARRELDALAQRQMDMFSQNWTNRGPSKWFRQP